MLLASQHKQVGFTLIELMIGVTIMGLLLALGMPSYRTWMQNQQIRNQAEALVEGLQIARNEAVKRNALVELVPTDSDPITNDPAVLNAIVPSAIGRNWVVRVQRPAGTYQAVDYIQSRSGINESRNALVAVSPAPFGSVFTFNSMGRAPGLPSGGVVIGGTAVNGTNIIVSNSSGTCQSAGGELRCLNVQVLETGSIRMCDPMLSGASHVQAC